MLLRTPRPVDLFDGRMSVIRFMLGPPPRSCPPVCWPGLSSGLSLGSISLIAPNSVGLSSTIRLNVASKVSISALVFRFGSTPYALTACS